MSQSKAVAAAKTKSKAVAPKRKADAAAPAAAAVPVAVASAAAGTGLSAEATALAARIEQAHRAGEAAAALDEEAVQALLAAVCKVYSAHVENGAQYGAFSQRNPVTPTDVMVTASGLLKAANLAVFELGMWQSWTGR